MRDMGRFYLSVVMRPGSEPIPMRCSTMIQAETLATGLVEGEHGDPASAVDIYELGLDTGDFCFLDSYRAVSA